MLAHLDTLIAFAVVMLGVSLIITTLTQAVSTVLGLRGTNLLWGVQTLLEDIDPALESQAEQILLHPMISDSISNSWFMSLFQKWPLLGRLVKRWRLASAIRSDELVRMLGKRAAELRAQNGPGENGGMSDAQIADRIDQALAAADSEAVRRVRMVREAFQTLAPNYAVQVDKSLDQIATNTQQAVARVEAWFNTTMDRVSQRFSTHLRFWTIGFSFALALGFQLDTFQIINQLWTDPQAREALVQNRGAMLKEASAVIQTTGDIPGAEPSVYKDAYADLKKKYPTETANLGDMPDVYSFDAAQKFLAGLTPAISEEYRKLVVTKLSAKADDIGKQLASSGLQLVPSWEHVKTFWSTMSQNQALGREFLGMLATGVLLSLGAPFWFNALKSLSNLRPILANKQDQAS